MRFSSNTDNLINFTTYLFLQPNFIIYTPHPIRPWVGGRAESLNSQFVGSVTTAHYCYCYSLPLLLLPPLPFLQLLVVLVTV